MNEATNSGEHSTPTRYANSATHNTTLRNRDESSASKHDRQENPSGDLRRRPDSMLSYQLLPTEFVQRQTSNRAVQLWSAIVFVLLASLCGLASSYWSQSHRVSAIHAELIARSEPIQAVQNNCSRLQQETKLIGHWIDAVDSAKPDDSALQILLAIAEATKLSDNPVAIESIELKLPLEYDTEGSRPKWAEPKLEIEVSLPTDNQQLTDATLPLNKLAETLVESKRVADARWRKVGDKADRVIVRIDGQPIATRMTP